MVCWDSTKGALWKRWHWDGLAGRLAAAQPQDDLAGRVALGLPWDDFTGMVAPGQPGIASPQGQWDWSCTDGLAGMAPEWPHWDSSGVASQSPIPVLTQLHHSGLWCPQPLLLPCGSRGSGKVRTGAPSCGTGALHDGGIGHQCFGEKLRVLGVSPLLLARVLKHFHFIPSNFQTYNLP